MSVFQHQGTVAMQLMCHLLRTHCVTWRYLRRAWWAALLALTTAVAWAQAGSAAEAQERVYQEVIPWVVQSQQVTAAQFSIAPLDARVQPQGCDRPLVMDLPFASRETVRVRCVGNPSWQLYLRLLFKPGAAAPPRSDAVADASASTAVARKVVVARQLLRAGTVVSADLLLEQDYSGPALDTQAVASIKDVVNGEMVREVPAGVPLRSHDVRRAMLVRMGQSVILTVSQSSGFSITARVEALQDGRMGDQVRLKNPESGRLLSGVVTGPGAAKGL
ncbi:MAG: flagellar basal body P-ring formation chaperone FlgA [Rhodoferax sp.]